jgi:peptide/nickel transport system substrate-binding protein
MSRRPWLSFGFFAPMLAALLLVIAVSCGGAATSTTAPQPEAAAPEAAVEEKVTEEAAEVQAAPAATPVPVAAPTATAVPEAISVTAQPYGFLNIGMGELNRYVGNQRYGVSGPGQSIANITTHEGMMTMDFYSQYQPNIVKEWSIAGDDRTWTFKLNKGVQFHQGWGEVTPEDIIFSARELGAIENPCGCQQTLAMFDNPDGYFIALDDYTLELDTVTPAWDVLTWLVAPGYGNVLSKKQWDSLLETQTPEQAAPYAVGTGPWERTEDMSIDEWNFTAVTDHWRKTPEFAGLKLQAIPEESTKIANFLTGKIDTWAAAEDSIPTVAEDAGTEFMSQKGTSEFYMIIWQNGYTYYGTDQQRTGYNPELAWVSSNPDLDSPEWERARKVREAIGLAVDRQKIVDTILGGEGLAESVYAWGTHRSRMPEDWKWGYDPDRARELLKEAGYEDGFDIAISPAFSSAPASVAQACQAVADMLSDVGIRATHEILPISTIYQQYKDRTQEGITCQYQNAYTQEPVWLHRFSYHPEGVWGLGWDHPWFTERVVKAYETFDAAERWEMQLEMGQWMRDNALGISVYAGNQIYPLGPKVGSWEEHLSMGRPTYISGLEYAIHRK